MPQNQTNQPSSIDILKTHSKWRMCKLYYRVEVTTKSILTKAREKLDFLGSQLQFRKKEIRGKKHYSIMETPQTPMHRNILKKGLI